MKVLNQIVATVLPFVPKFIVQKVSSKYIAGSTLADAVRVVRALNAQHAMATVDVLGEFIKDLHEARQNTEYCCEVLRAILRENLDSNLSIKLTSLGLGLDDAQCERNIQQILECAKAEGNIFVRFDMENSPYTDRTINFYRTFKGAYNVGLVLQAYMRRTQDDIRNLLREGPINIRLCKGIYVEAPEIAFQGYDEVRKNFVESLELLLSNGAYVGIATHDGYLVNEGKRLVAKYNLDKSKYEFQMLLGVREELRKQIIREGHRLRVYVPFGADWYGYSIRRLKENPNMAGNIFKAMLRLER